MFRRLRWYFSLGCPSWFVLSAALLSSELRQTEGLTVTSSGWRRVQKAEGDQVILDCRFSQSPSDTGDLDIEWSLVSPDSTTKDRLLLSFTSGTEHRHDDRAAAGGLGFAAGDPSNGDASLSIAQLTPAHSATYQCKVKKPPGVDTRKMSLVVMVKPSVPKCWVEWGEAAGGGGVSLHCLTAGGSPPLQYKWRRERKEPLPAAASQNGVTGELRISNYSHSFAGVYLCEVTNAVGAERCRIDLKANKPNRAGVIMGNVVGSLLLIFVFLVYIVLLHWKLRNRRHYEKEFANEIREDTPPPDSRPASRRTGRTTAQNPRATSCQTDASEVGRSPSSNSRGRTPVKYAAAQCESRDAV